ncbi:MAG TPA: glycine cleavage system protein GcvH [Alphaproteobacteria bacterium]|jgi:glycine cleavage system H protein
MSSLKYSKDHEWLRVEGDSATMGISDYAQEQLGDIVYVELPAVGRKVKAAEQIAVVESVKAASEVYAPVTGEVIAANDKLAENPGLVNSAPTGEGWFVKLKLADPGELAGLMDEAAYRDFVASLA